MAPKEVNIAIIEDDRDYRETAIEFLENGGHQVVDAAGSLDEATGLIGRLREKKVQVVLVDSNLDEKDPLVKHGSGLIRVIKEQDPKIITVGFSTRRKGVEGADFNVRKGEVSASDLSQFIDSL